MSFGSVIIERQSAGVHHETRKRLREMGPQADAARPGLPHHGRYDKPGPNRPDGHNSFGRRAAADLGDRSHRATFPAAAAERNGFNAVVLAGYIITRATGDAIGTAPHAAGLSGFGDGLSAALEAIVIAGCTWVLTARLGRQVSRQRLIMAPATTGAMTAVQRIRTTRRS
jgi:hypothetical protein